LFGIKNNNMIGDVKNKELQGIIREFKTEIRNSVTPTPEKVILFGSHARVEAVEGSDIDLLLIFNKKVSSGTIKKIRDISNLISFKNEVVISEFLFADRDFKEHKTPFLMNVKKEGILV